MYISTPKRCNTYVSSQKTATCPREVIAIGRRCPAPRWRLQFQSSGSLQLLRRLQVWRLLQLAGLDPYSNKSKLEFASFELSCNHREVEEEDAEEEVAFKAMQEYLDVHDMEDEAEEDVLAPALCWCAHCPCEASPALGAAASQVGGASRVSVYIVARGC